MDNATANDRHEHRRDATHERRADESGARGGSTRGPDVPAPFSPDSDDESPLGDTDQHSDA
jgi:hypothetical protein